MLLTDLIDPLRRIAEADLEPFQSRDRFGEISGRTESFALFLLNSLHRLQEQSGLKTFGLSLTSRIETIREAGVPVIVVSHDVKAIEEGLIKEPIDIGAFYSQCFPFNAVLEGKFSLDRQDDLVQSYLKAAQIKDIEARRAVLSVLCLRCAAAFPASDLQLVTPPSKGDDLPFIHEPV